jgi:hypothetical protein
VTVYWFPDGAGYRAVDVDEVVHVDVHCRPCGEHRSPRLARFVRPAVGGPVGVQPFVVDGQQQGPAFWVRDRVLRWRLVCPHGHDTNCRLDQIEAVLDAVAAGTVADRVSL